MMSSFFVAVDNGAQLVDHQWDGYTLLLPCVSVGNVPQLALDLQISSLLKTSATSEKEKDLKLVGYIRSSNVHPFAGPDPFSLHGPLLATSIQVFVSEAKKLVVIQQRSPIFKEYRAEFYAELLNWLSKHCFSLILLLSSSFDQYLAPAEKETSSFPTKFIGANLSNTTKDYLKKLQLSAIEPDAKNCRIHLPGSGSARAYLKTLGPLAATNKTDLLCLVMFCSEGDNRQHAFKLADTVADLVNYRVGAPDDASSACFKVGKGSCGSDFAWTVPFSWRTLYGEEPPSEIF